MFLSDLKSIKLVDTANTKCIQTVTKQSHILTQISNLQETRIFLTSGLKTKSMTFLSPDWLGCQDGGASVISVHSSNGVITEFVLCSALDHGTSCHSCSIQRRVSIPSLFISLNCERKHGCCTELAILGRFWVNRSEVRTGKHGRCRGVVVVGR